MGGDITTGDGTGGESIYGTELPDENYDLLHNCPGVLLMVHVIPGGNSSQFHLCTVPKSPAVVFAHLISDEKVVQKILQGETINGSLVSPALIADSGQLP